jgi:hypothetical protein
MSGLAWCSPRGTKCIEAPYPRSPLSLAIFLHEVGHHFIGLGTYKKRCEEEYRAWIWAIQQMREYGYEPDKRTWAYFDRNIRWSVRKAIWCGCREFPAILHLYVIDAISEIPNAIAA